MAFSKTLAIEERCVPLYSLTSPGYNVIGGETAGKLGITTEETGEDGDGGGLVLGETLGEGETEYDGEEVGGDDAENVGVTTGPVTEGFAVGVGLLGWGVGLVPVCRRIARNDITKVATIRLAASRIFMFCLRIIRLFIPFNGSTYLRIVKNTRRLNPDLELQATEVMDFLTPRTFTQGKESKPQNATNADKGFLTIYLNPNFLLKIKKGRVLFSTCVSYRLTLLQPQL